MKEDFSLADTDLCVMCAMCTPHCPTYRIYKTETESPRGRIALMQALDKGNLAPTEKLMDNLNHCLGCLACERICPSNVPFGKLMDSTRQRFTAGHYSYTHKLLLRFSQYKRGLDYFHRFILWLKHWRLVSWLPQKSVTRSLLEQAQAHRLKSFYPAQGTKSGTVALFKGCLGQTFDGETLLDAIALLTHSGFDVQLPPSQFCCGALHQHNGDIQSAKELAEKNRQLFKQYDLDAILYTASGCGSQIVDTGFSVPTVDIVAFILKHLSKHDIKFTPLKKSVVMHQGCSNNSQINIGQQLLKIIPDINIRSFQSAELCCGAGGSHQLEYPELARNLLAIKLDELKTMPTDYLVSDNLSCRLHFKAELQRNKLDIEVIHPVTLLRRQLI